MLVLSRRPGESLRIDENIRITLVACSAGQVRLAIDAPDHVEILREEVYERIASANLAAAGAQDGVVRRAVTRLRGSSGNRTSNEANRKGGQHG
ncbi:MAG: carbon storage regulator CsrA [Myxococcota bacterium]|nr:carbon storage regulator CsrA [Myxococcota bacterium]